MSILVSTAIERMHRDLNSVGQEADTGDFYWSLDKAVEYFYQQYALPTVERITDIILYPSVREYALPTDFVDIIPLRKAGMDSLSPTFTGGLERDMYRDIRQKSLSVRFDRDTPFLVAIDDGNAKIVLDDCSSATGWTISGDGSDLKVNDRQYVNGSSSLQFTVEASGGTTTLSKTLGSQIDLSENPATLRGFFDLFCPRTNSVALTSVKLRIGNSASNYYQWTKTTRYRGNTITGGWGKIGAYFEQAALLTQSGDFLTTQDGSQILLQGTVDLSAIDYVAIVITHGTTGVDGTYHIDDIFVSKGNAYELPYYSNQVIEASSGSFKAGITAEDDTILLPLKTDGAVIYKALEYLAAERKRDSGLANYFARELLPHEAEIRTRYPKETLIKTSSWMKPSRS